MPEISIKMVVFYVQKIKGLGSKVTKELIVKSLICGQPVHTDIARETVDKALKAGKIKLLENMFYDVA